MNNKNAFGFLLLGLLMYATPVIAQSLATHPEVVSEATVRTVWLELMGWVVGAIGSAYLLREGAIRMPVLLARCVPERLLRPVDGRVEPALLPVRVRVGVSS